MGTEGLIWVWATRIQQAAVFFLVLGLFIFVGSICVEAWKACLAGLDVKRLFEPGRRGGLAFWRPVPCCFWSVFCSLSVLTLQGPCAHMYELRMPVDLNHRRQVMWIEWRHYAHAPGSPWLPFSTPWRPMKIWFSRRKRHPSAPIGERHRWRVRSKRSGRFKAQPARRPDSHCPVGSQTPCRKGSWSGVKTRENGKSW